MSDDAASAVVDACAEDLEAYGARPLRRYVDQVVATQLASASWAGRAFCCLSFLKGMVSVYGANFK